LSADHPQNLLPVKHSLRRQLDKDDPPRGRLKIVCLHMMINFLNFLGYKLKWNTEVEEAYPEVKMASLPFGLSRRPQPMTSPSPFNSNLMPSGRLRPYSFPESMQALHALSMA
jgi:hypothetical protein